MLHYTNANWQLQYQLLKPILQIMQIWGARKTRGAHIYIYRYNILVPIFFEFVLACLESMESENHCTKHPLFPQIYRSPRDGTTGPRGCHSSFGTCALLSPLKAVKSGAITICCYSGRKSFTGSFSAKSSENLMGPFRLKKVVHISMNSIAVWMLSRGFLFDGVARKHNVTIPFAGKFRKWSFPTKHKNTFLVTFKGDKINRTLQTWAFSIAASMSRDLRDLEMLKSWRVLREPWDLKSLVETGVPTQKVCKKNRSKSPKYLQMPRFWRIPSRWFLGASPKS